MEMHLPSVIANVTRSARAWRTVSTDGSSRCVSVSNVVLTLAEHRLPTSPNPAPSLLGALNTEASSSLEWLRDAVRRLARIAQGVDDALHALVSVQSIEPLIWSLTARQWHDLIAVVGKGMRADLVDKQGSLAVIETAIRGEGFDRHALEICGAMWLEQPRLRDYDAELLSTALDAEIEAKRAMDMAAVTADSGSLKVEADRAEKRCDISPAMAMLLGGKG